MTERIFADKTKLISHYAQDMTWVEVVESDRRSFYMRKKQFTLDSSSKEKTTKGIHNVCTVRSREM
jgi:hypothetical protein